jgi:shikimate kinase
MEKGRFVFVIGFMASGKTTAGKLLANRLGRSFFDTDDLVEEKAGMRIRELFDRQGEARFRELERELLVELKNASEGTVRGGSGVRAGVGAGRGVGHRLGRLRADIAAGRGVVISTGGGLPCGSGNMRLMKELGAVVYLRASVDDILERLSRMRDGADRPVFRELRERALAKRGPEAQPPSSSAFDERRALRGELAALLAARETFYLEADLVVKNSEAQGREETVSLVIEALSALEPGGGA